MQKMDFYKKHPKLTILVAAIILLVIIEVLCGFVIFFSHHLFGTPRIISLFRFHPIFTGINILQYETNWAEPYPVFGYINRINFSGESGYTTDRYGFIHNGDKDRTIDKEAFTIFMLGGSTLAGHGASSNAQTIPAHLERLLQEKYHNVKVINAGTAGYYSAKELLKISNEILFLNPDIVITFGGTNDFTHKYKVEYKGRKHAYFISPYDINLFQTLEKTRSLVWAAKNLIYNLTKFTEYTYTRFVLEKGISAMMGRTGSSARSGIVANVKRICGISRIPEQELLYNDKGFEEDMEERISYYLSYVKQAQALVNGMGKKYYYILQPVLYNEKKELPDTEQAALQIARYGFFKKFGIDIVKRGQYFWRRVAEEFSPEGIKFYDFTGVFSGKSEYYNDYEHYTDSGNLEIAKKINHVLIEDKAIPDALRNAR